MRRRTCCRAHGWGGEGLRLNLVDLLREAPLAPGDHEGPCVGGTNEKGLPGTALIPSG